MNDREWNEYVRMKVSNGDAYPSFMRHLTRPARVMSDQSVNVAAGVGVTQSGWVGLRVWVMAPDQGTAEEIIPAFAALLASFEFNGTAKGILAMLSDVRKGVAEIEPESEMWPAGAPALQRHGVRGASRTGCR